MTYDAPPAVFAPPRGVYAPPALFTPPRGVYEPRP